MNQFIEENGGCIMKVNGQGGNIKKYRGRMVNVYGNEVKKKAYNQICMPIYKNRECIIKSDFI